MNVVQVNSSALIEVWKNDRDIRDCHSSNTDNWQKFAKMVAQRGNKMIISSCWYLNYICYGEDWIRYYNCDPLSFTGNVKNLTSDFLKGE